ncbi:MAG: pentapeptide repeat-containing protein [Pseudonocardia sp.]
MRHVYLDRADLDRADLDRADLARADLHDLARAGRGVAG